ncbi:MAG: acyl-CoA dehydrogenase C-terminal domain-containing protein, partial [Pseudomonadota bacterium]
GLMAEKSQEALKEGANGSSEFHENKLMTGRYFMERIMPECTAHLARIQSGADSMMALDAEAF